MSATEGLQHVSHDASQGLYYDPQSEPHKAHDAHFQSTIPDGPEHFMPSAVENRQEGRICGFRRKWFCVLVGVIVVLVAASIGGGVGGAIAGRNQACPTK